MYCEKGSSYAYKKYRPGPRIHLPFSRMFYVFFTKFYKFEYNTASDWLNHTVCQSEVVLHSNVSKFRKVLRIRQRTLRMVGEYGPRCQSVLVAQADMVLNIFFGSIFFM